MTEKQKAELKHRIREAEYEEIRIYALRLTRNHALAEEFTQETFLRFLVQEEKSPIQARRAWLYRTARNLIFDFFRRQKKREEICAYLTAVSSAGISQQAMLELEEKEMEEMLLQKINSLSPRHREAVRLKFQEKLRYDEIADVMGETRSSVGKLLSEAIRQLREWMKD